MAEGRLLAVGATLARLPVGDHNTLSYTPAISGPVPIPGAERDLPTVWAEPFFQVSDKAFAIEGPAFDREGNLLFLDIYGGRVLCLSPAGRLTTVFVEEGLTPGGMAIHKDGRIFLACLGTGDSHKGFTAGSVVAIAPDGSDRQTIVPPDAGLVLDDMVFDDAGGFYMTDFKGISTEPIGGVYYVPPSHDRIQSVLPNFCAANGVALSPDNRTLWATEFGACRLHRADLSAPGVIGRFGASIPYHFIGRAPDSMRTDSHGNVYVAMYHQARIMVFNAGGIPIGQILLPGRDKGQFLKSTSLAIRPGSRDMVIVARDENGDGGTAIFAARGFAEGFAMFSHQ